MQPACVHQECRNDYGRDFCLFVPIPYSVTNRGRVELTLALMEGNVLKCTHSWEAINGYLVCSQCGDERQLYSPAAQQPPRSVAWR